MKKFILIFSAVIASCAPTTQFPDVNKDLAAREAEIQREITLKERHKYFTRLQDVSAPIFLANAEICPENKVKPFYGFHISSTDAVGKEFEAAARKVHGLNNRATIYHISPKTPAIGKFQKGDEIIQINDQKIKSGKKGLGQALDYLYDEKRLDETTNFIIARGGNNYTVAVNPKAACGGRALLSDDSIMNAFADGENIIFTKPMMDLTKTDSELALIVGHEIAHNSRKHIESKQGNALIGMVLGTALSVATGVNVMGLGSDLGGMAFSQSFEAEADYVGLYHVARAGYEIDEAPYLWRRMAAANPASIDMVGASHPSNSHRFVALEATVKEIKAKQAAGQALIPEEKKAEELKNNKSQYN